ncbi:TonB-dependent receptor [Persicitalea jodogahamensis]|nr:TonB-dependent receptor [Persicitalea jodogahamensis]
MQKNQHGANLWLRIMKITTVQIFMTLLLSGISWAVPAQELLNKRIFIPKENTEMRNALALISKVAKVKITYNSQLIPKGQSVLLYANDERLEEVLNRTLNPAGVSFVILNKQIVLRKAEAPRPDNESQAVDQAPDRRVTGRVLDENKAPLPGVSIVVKGTSRGTTTDTDGRFSIDIPDGATQLIFSFVGYVTQEIEVGNQSELNLTLAVDSKSLEEVVVIGYNRVKKSDLTGSVVSVGAEEIRKRPVANVLQAIQGRAAGVDITSNERPGEMGSIRIRGSRSLSAGNSPLYVVDGIPLAAGGIESFNPNDIESIDILKDASATAVFGSRGANGVVLVTTKQGKRGKLSLNYIGTATIENMQDRTQMMNSGQYIEFRRDAYRRAGNYPAAPTLQDDRRIFGGDANAWANVAKGWQNGTWDGSLVPTTDWTGMVLKTGVTQDHTLSVSGGTDKMKAYGSIGYLFQDGTQLGQDFERFNSKFSVELNPVKWLRFGGSINGTYSIQNYGYATSNATGPGNLYFAAQGMLPYAVPFDSTGSRINLPGGDINILNPIGEDRYNINERKVLRTLGVLFAEVDIMKGLRYRVNFGPDFYHLRNGRWMDRNSVNRGGGEPGSTNYAQLNQTSRFSWTLDNLLYYNRTIAEKHDFGVTLLQSASSNLTETSTMMATALPWDSQRWHQLNSVSSLDAFGTGLSESQLASYMARVNYGFDNKYLLTASLRWDGASQLAEGNKWDVFPSAAFAWNIDQESFLKPVNWITQLKTRIGVGSTGNAAISPYQTKGAIETLYYTWGSKVEAGYVSSDASLANPVAMANLNLGWEHTTQWNWGLDFELFNRRLSGTLDLYTSRTTDLLLLRSIPSIVGYVSTWDNIGATSNKGIDLTLNTVNLRTRDFEWSSTLNFSANRDRIEKLANGANDDLSNRWFIGQRLAVYYDYVKEGIWQNTPEDQSEIEKFNANGHSFRPGDIRVADLNGDYRIDANNDRQVIGHSSPKWNFGLNNTFTYRNWDLAVFIFGRFGFTLATGSEALQGRFAQRVVDYWTPDNPTNNYPSPNYNSAAGDPFRSSMNYQDGSFIKVRNVSLGYNLPGTITSKLRMANCRLYLQMQNPGLLYSGISWVDPDLGGSTFNRGVVFGLNVGF